MLLNLQHPNLLTQFTWLKLKVSFVCKTIWKKKYPTESIWYLAKHIENKKLLQQKRHTHFEFEIQKIIILLEIYCHNGLKSILKEHPYFYFYFYFIFIFIRYDMIRYNRLVNYNIEYKVSYINVTDLGNLMTSKMVDWKIQTDLTRVKTIQ